MNSFDFKTAQGAGDLAQKCQQQTTVAFGAGASVLWAMMHIDKSAIPAIMNWLLNGASINFMFCPMMLLSALTIASIGQEWRHKGALCRTLGDLLAPRYSAAAGLAAGWIVVFLALGVVEDHRRLFVALGVGGLALLTLFTPTVILLAARHMADKVSARWFVHEWRIYTVRGAAYVLVAVACWGFVETVLLAR